MNQNGKKKVFLFLRLLISFGLIAYIFYKISAKHELSELPTYFSHANYLWLAGAVLLLIVLLGIGSLRWGILLRAQGVRLRPASVFMYYMIGMFFNNFLPSTVGGDVVKAYYLTRFTGKGAESFVSVAMDRIMGIAGMTVVAVVACLAGGRILWENPATRPHALSIFLITGGVLCGLVAFFLVIFSGRAMGIFFRLVKWEKVRNKIKKFHDSLYVYKGKRKVLLQALLISVGIWILICLLAAMIYMAFHAPVSPPPAGKIAPIAIGYFFLFLPVISVIMSLPISLAGMGAREEAFIVFFGALNGITDLDALVMALTFLFVYLAASSIGGIIYVLKDQLHFHREDISELEARVEVAT